MALPQTSELRESVKHFEKWFAALKPLKLDVAGDFAGRELFAIHGESLLAYCVESANVDFHYGFQLLHAVHAVETLLDKIKQRGCNYHVLWFDDEQDLCVPLGSSGVQEVSYKFLLARAVLIRHFSQLEQGAPTFSYRFPSLNSDSFRDYLDQNPLRFFLGSDGGASPGGQPREKLVSNGLCKFCTACPALGFASRSLTALISAGRDGLAPLIKSGVPTTRTKYNDTIHLTPENALTARESVSLRALCYVLMAPGVADSTATMTQAAALLVHLVILRCCDLSQRSVPQRYGSGLVADEPANRFIRIFSDAARHFLLDGDFTSLKWDAFDLFDGRVYNKILSDLKHLALPANLYMETLRLSHIVKEISGFDLSEYLLERQCLELAHAKKQECGRTTLQPGSATSAFSSVLPFSHPVMDQYLKQVKLETDAAITPDSPAAPPKIFQELTHWHNAKKPLDAKHVPKPAGFWARKRNQMFMRDTIAYSASLTGASGKNIEPEIVVVDSGSSSVAEKRNVVGGPSTQQTGKEKDVKNNKKENNKHKKPSGKNKALEAAEKIKAEKLRKQSQAVGDYWTQRRQDIESIKSPVSRYLTAEKFLWGLSSTHTSVIGAEVSLYLCHVLVTMLSSSGRAGSSKANAATLALLWSKVVTTKNLILTREVATQLAELATPLQIPLPLDLASLPSSRNLPFKTPKSSISSSLSSIPYGKSPLEFQLDHCGPYLERSFDSRSDSRVTSFNPDAWQRKVLDAIDTPNTSLLSFYAMKKILKGSDDDVLVYVAPTKALVNQIAAEVQARFTKTYPHSGRSVWVIHTRDYRVNNVKGCQILVTVPQVIQILLLAPHDVSWSRRVKRIIFDEVHCIGQSEEGIIWEQLLLLAPCPVIALSATVANPLEFKTWLENAQRVKGYNLETVVHGSRYSDLRKFIYDTPKSPPEFKGLEPVERLPLPGLDAADDDDNSGGGRFVFVHPVGSIVEKSTDTLNDAALEPRDCLSLWRCMVQHQTNTHRVDPSLDPAVFLPKGLVKKSDIVEWETALKQQLASWMADSKSPFEAVRQDLRGGRYRQLTASTSTVSDGSNNSMTDKKSIGRSAVSLILDLRTNGALPAILFNYDREGCETTLAGLYNILEHAEDKYKATNPAWKGKLAKYDAWKTTQEYLAKKATKISSSAKNKDKGGEGGGLSKEDLGRESAQDRSERGVWESFDPDAPIPEFSFSDDTKITLEELDERLQTLDSRSIYRLSTPDPSANLLCLPCVGVWACITPVVEMLFRKGFLTVVIATGTLALGLNMPCKTTVFTGDSIYLTALNYRQASGRAGRRGFDLLGNVVFHDIPPHRALEIMSAKLPDLRGQFPVSVTLILRLFKLLHGTNNSEYAATAIKSLLTQSQLYLGSGGVGGDEAAQMPIQHHLRSSIDYLRRQHLLSANGEPLNFSGIVGHLYYTENAAFAFHSLLRGGYFHELCADLDTKIEKEDVLRKIVLVLCHIFCRVSLTRYKDKRFLEGVVHRSPSLVILPALPERALEILQEHNNQTLKVFQGYVHSYVTQHLYGKPDRQLPLTKHTVTPNSGVDMTELLGSQPATTVRSPFSALSGATDTFTTISELCSAVRSGVFLEESAIPYIPITSEELNGIPWNAYIYDFSKHGDRKAIVHDNGIRSGDLWFKLKDFSLVLATIVTSLANFLDPNVSAEDIDETEKGDGEEGIDIKTWEGESYRGEGRDDNDFNVQGTNKAPSVSSSLLSSSASWKKGEEEEERPKKGKKKKVVVESWEDELKEEDLNDSQSESKDSTNRKKMDDGGGYGGKDGQTLYNVYKAFLMVQEEFDMPKRYNLPAAKENAVYWREQAKSRLIYRTDGDGKIRWRMKEAEQRRDAALKKIVVYAPYSDSCLFWSVANTVDCKVLEEQTGYYARGAGK
ncbi:P-loop containing nucleoside triphosphate hydrolase protein [Diplogelasinospora grovesii]|uniref:P-loop containing nucleoside triphosphate hydrolase protein n=1 Tax=Diplogelasinospora grovesii TaxID=303347 RepID=A0AAN6N2Q4_9PEZI|nr:P-loop containing nucleoside triphosphate hydrolase protein [Diplogelasinospora grovesii]